VQRFVIGTEPDRRRIVCLPNMRTEWGDNRRRGGDNAWRGARGNVGFRLRP